MLRTSDFPGVFRALGDGVKAAAGGGAPAWAGLELSVCRTEDHPALRIDDLSSRWRPGDPPPVALFVRRRPAGGGTCFTVSLVGDLLVGFVRLKTAPAATELRLDIGGQGFGGVTLWRSAGSFVFAHADRFMVPLVNLFPLHEVRVVTSSPSEDQSIGIVCAYLDAVERREMCHRGAFCGIAAAGNATFYHGRGGQGSGGRVELPDMRALLDGGSMDRAAERAERT